MAAGNGQFEIVKYLFDRSLEMNSEVQDGAASGRFPLFTDRAIKQAAERGHFKLVKWMHDKTKPLQQEQDFVGILADPYTSVDKAIEFGSLEMDEWLYEHRPHECSEDAIFKAASNGSLELVQFLYWANPQEFETKRCEKLFRLVISKWLSGLWSTAQII